MNFLQPWMLAGLPLITLPVLIHLINQRRHQTKRWAAMMFLLDAKRMTQGMARLRHLLILLMRVLAVAGIIFAVSRPLATGWMGLAGGQPDTTIVILDRSASMEQQDLVSGVSKRAGGLRKIVDLLEKLGNETRIVLIESSENRAYEIETAAALLESPLTLATDTTSNIPAMIQTAREYISANQSGRTDVWICSDLRENDWDPNSGRWEALRDSFAEMQGIHFHLLCYDKPASENVSVWVTSAKRRAVGKRVELVLDVHLRRNCNNPLPINFPLELSINGNRSVINIEMPDAEYALQGHTILLAGNSTDGWGCVELPSDGNPADNVCYFVFAEEPVYRTVIVSENPERDEFLRLVMAAPIDPAIEYSVELISPGEIESINWNDTAMIIWHAQLPARSVADRLLRYVERDRALVFFPPESINGNRLFETKWEQWEDTGAQAPLSVATWRGDSDLLSHTMSGDALPVGDLHAMRYCTLSGRGITLAQFDGGVPLLERIPTDLGSVYFCSTLPHADHSNLAEEPVVAYVMLHRALIRGAVALDDAKQILAGSDQARFVVDWTPLVPKLKKEMLSLRPLRAGAYGDKNYKTLIALNRPVMEDSPRTVTKLTLNKLFNGLNYRVIDDELGSLDGLVSEVWRAFVVLMGFALLVEALLCFPVVKKKESISEMLP